MVSTGFVGLVAALAVLVAGCGDDGPVNNGIAIATNVGTPDSPRTIEIAMVDIAFQPTAVTVQAGETVRFVFTNDGTLDHEATFGDVIMTFDDPDVPSTIIGCHVPGHWEAGMRVDVTIATA